MRWKTVVQKAGIALRHPGMAYGWCIKRLRGLPSLETVYVECSGRCNLACRFCFLGCTPEPLGLMSRETYLAVARSLFPFAYAVNFVGYGEPLMNNELPWMVALARSYGREAHVTTNGILLNEERICELIGAGTGSLAVSLDGASEETHDANRGRGSFAETVRNMEILKKVKEELGAKRPLLVLDTLLTVSNRGEIPELLAVARRVGAGVVNLAHVQACSKEEARLSLAGRDDLLEGDYRDWKEKAKSLGLRLRLPHEFDAERRQGCYWNPGRRLAVTWEGEIRPCCFLFHSAGWYHEGKMVEVEAPRFGNIASESFPRIWSGEAYVRFRARVAKGELPRACRPCLLRSRESGPGGAS